MTLVKLSLKEIENLALEVFSKNGCVATPWNPFGTPHGSLGLRGPTLADSWWRLGSLLTCAVRSYQIIRVRGYPRGVF